MEDTKRPYMVFANEGVDDINAITQTYDIVNIDAMIDIVHRKRCHQGFFTVYLGNGKYMSCSTNTRHINYFESWMLDDIIQILYEHPDAVIEFGKPSLRTVEENKKYRMKMPEDSFSIFNDRLIGTMYGDDLIVEFVLKSGKAFIVHDGKYLTEHGTFVSEMPEEGFDIYENGVGFRDKMMDIEWYKASYGEVVFNKSDGVDVFFED